MWSIYDALIEKIPDSIKVTDCCCGKQWCYVKWDGGMGTAMCLSETSRPAIMPNGYIGASLKEVALCSKSWNLMEASLGVAAINAWYNVPKIKDNTSLKTAKNDGARDAFLTYQEAIAGKNVAVIGHFPHLEKRFNPICNLSILERCTQQGDYPDSACEYILPNQDYVFITGSALTNKTLPRLLQLSKNSQTILVGPSVPLATELFDFGVDSLEGFLVKDYEKSTHAIKEVFGPLLFSYGEMVSLEKGDYNYET
ncbi:MAG: DUF364 domain-containing protein [Anaerovoracaceae bacterium]